MIRRGFVNFRLERCITTHRFSFVKEFIFITSHRIVHLGPHQLLAVMLPTLIETRIREEKVN